MAPNTFCNMPRRYILSFLVCLFHMPVFAQQDTLLERLIGDVERNAQGTPGSPLYLHLDKSIYVHNEHVWFTGYLVNGNRSIENTVYVLLVDQVRKKTVLREQFVLEDGLCKGSLMLPASLEAGEYRFVAYTNSYLTHPKQQVFQQVLSIRGTDKKAFTLNDISTTDNLGKDTAVLKYKVITGELGLAIGAKFDYALYAGNTKIDTGSQKADRFGEVSLRYPGLIKEQRELLMVAKIRYKEDTLTFRMPVVLPAITTIKWYPEGGDLIHGHTADCGFEITKDGQALAAKGKLFADGIPVMDFKTGVSGRGSLHFVPDHSKKYTVKLDEETGLLVSDFPEVKQRSFGIHVENGVVADTLTADIFSGMANNGCYLLLHNYREAFWGGKMASFNKDETRKLRLDVRELPKGVATLTLFDENGDPVAERAVYLVPQHQFQVQMQTDTSVYNTRSKVKLKVKITDEKGTPVMSFFSFACVLDKRIDSLRYADITRYIYFDQYLPEAGNLPPASYFSKTANLEELLLTQYWTRYRWKAPQKTILSGPEVKDNDLHGYVLFKQKPVKKPVPMILIGSGGIMTLTTDSAGKFTIPNANTRIPTDGKILLGVAGEKSTDAYSVYLRDDFDTLNKILEQNFVAMRPQKEDLLSAEEKTAMKSMLSVVVVKAKKWDSYGTFTSKDCNDYVCMYNILNCRNHKTGTKPQNGATYSYTPPGSMTPQQVVYHSCAADAARDDGFMKKVRGTYYAKQFYVADYAKLNPQDQEVHTTIHWMHAVITNENGEADIEFYTNDLPGRFTCILQGFCNQGVLSGKHSFRVEK